MELRELALVVLARRRPGRGLRFSLFKEVVGYIAYAVHGVPHHYALVFRKHSQMVGMEMNTLHILRLFRKSLEG